jgi:lysophospholipase L1-like esterase
VIPEGSVAVSDSVALTIPALSDLVIDLYLPGETSAPLTAHNGAFQTNYVSTAGNHLGVPSIPIAATTQSWFLIARVEVLAPESVGAIVAFGDSITDGTRSTPDTNNRWPDHLARRLLAGGAGISRMAVLNAGIAGNRVLGDGIPTPAYNAGVSALARFDRNALTKPGVTHIVVLEGINDIRGFAGPGTPRQEPTPSAVDITRGYRQLIERAHSQGLKIYGATLTPFGGSNGWSAEDEAKRQAVNEWIRTSGAYDGVIDFDKAVRDPKDPTKLLPEYDSGDHLHPSDAGYRAMADSIDLKLFAPSQGPGASR